MNAETATGPADERANWPTTECGVVDWETVFEDPEDGLIAMVRQAQSTDIVRDCVSAVVHKLFAREDDATRREALMSMVDQVILAARKGNRSEAAILSEAHAGVSAVLRGIKNHRRKRAAAAAARIAAGLAPRAEAAVDRRAPADDEAVPAAGREEEAGRPAERWTILRERAYPPADPADLKAVFADGLSEAMRQRFRVLQEGLDAHWGNDDRLPFLLAPEFFTRFERTLRTALLPIMLSECTDILNRLAPVPPAERTDFLDHVFSSAGDREAVIAAWETAWQRGTTPEPLPREPEVYATKKNPVLETFARWRKAAMDEVDDEEDDVEEGESLRTRAAWEEAVQAATETNAAAEQAWADLTAAAHTFIPPRDDDHAVLMSLFARTPATLRNQIQALHQVAAQGSGAERAFDRFQRGREVDLPLLVLCHRHPDLFLGRKALLRRFARGFSDQDRKARIPLTCRFLGDYI